MVPTSAVLLGEYNDWLGCIDGVFLRIQATGIVLQRRPRHPDARVSNQRKVLIRLHVLLLYNI